jgi:type II secretory pathway pseudopilin PulG
MTRDQITNLLFTNTLIEMMITIGMLLLLIASLGLGWSFGGPSVKNRQALTLTTSLRNVGDSLTI